MRKRACPIPAFGGTSPQAGKSSWQRVLNDGVGVPSAVGVARAGGAGAARVTRLDDELVGALGRSARVPVEDVARGEGLHDLPGLRARCQHLELVPRVGAARS